MKKVLVILGSSASSGDTAAIVKEIFEGREVEVVDLLTKNISYYDYEHKNKDDDFLPIAEKMTEAEVIVFATPVYWYAMSAQLKTFFDRLTDLLEIRKELGRDLAGKLTYLVAAGFAPDLPDGFDIPFADTSTYFKMSYQGSFYYQSPKDKVITSEAKEAAAAFADKIFAD